MPLILANITSYDVVSLIMVFHSWSVGRVGDFQCLDMTLAAEAIPTIRTKYALFVRVGVSVLSPKGINGEILAGLFSPMSPKTSAHYAKMVQPRGIRKRDAKRFLLLLFLHFPLLF